jgi:hypothetical protein
MVYVPWPLYVNASLVVPLIAPEQLSVAVGILLTVTEHSPLAVGKVAESGTGAVVSSTMTVWVWVVLFPLPSS